MAQRYEFQEGTSSKFWEIAVEGDSFTVRYGRIGAAGTTQTKSFASAALAEKAAAKLVAEKTGKGYVAVAGAGEAAPAAADPAPAPPPAKKAKAAPEASSAASFEGITDKSLKSLAAKVPTLVTSFGDISKLSKALRKAADEDYQRGYDLGWHLLEHRLVDSAAGNRGLLKFLEGNDVSEARARVIAEVLERLDGESGDTMPGWTYATDALVHRAYAVARQEFAAREAAYPEALRDGMTLIRARSGESVSADAGRAVMAKLARSQTTGYGICGNIDMPYMAGGELVDLDLSDLSDLRTIALLLGSEADWDRLLLDETKRNEWGLIENVRSALVALPLPALVELFVDRAVKNKRLFGDSSCADTTIVEIFTARADDPAALVAAAAPLDPTNHDHRQLRRTLAQAAERACDERALARPAGLGRLLSDDEN